MGVYRVERTISLSGTGGPNITSQIAVPHNSFRGVLRAVEVRYASGDHVFTGLNLGLGMYPKNLVAAGIALDPVGRPAAALDFHTTIPAERRVWSAAVTAGSASALATCFTETIPGEDRPVAAGPLSLSAQWTVSGGTTSTFVVSFEFDTGVE